MAEQVARDSPAAPLGCGVVGCGYFGRLLARALDAHASAKVVAVADVSTPAAEAAGEEFGCEVAPDVPSLVARDDVDIVFVATPNHAHVEPTLIALTGGKDVFVEKPMALRGDDCKRMLQVAAATRRRLLVGHIMRVLPAVQEMRQAIAAGEIGRPILGRAVHTRWADFSDKSLDWWKLNSALSGGELLHEIHQLDLLCWLLGDVDDVTLRIANLAHPAVPAYDDVSQLSLRFASGALATVEMGTAYHFPEWSFVIGGTEGAFNLDLRAGTLTTYLPDGTTTVRGVFEDESANESLRAAATVKQRGYNTPGQTPPRWMEHAVELEVRNAVEHFQWGSDSPLLEARDQAVRVTEEALRRR